MAVPKNKRYKQVVRTRRSSEINNNLLKVLKCYSPGSVQKKFSNYINTHKNIIINCDLCLNKNRLREEGTPYYELHEYNKNYFSHSNICLKCVTRQKSNILFTKKKINISKNKISNNSLTYWHNLGNVYRPNNISTYDYISEGLDPVVDECIVFWSILDEFRRFYWPNCARLLFSSWTAKEFWGPWNSFSQKIYKKRYFRFYDDYFFDNWSNDDNNFGHWYK